MSIPCMTHHIWLYFYLKIVVMFLTVIGNVRVLVMFILSHNLNNLYYYGGYQYFKVKAYFRLQAHIIPEV